MNELNYLGQDRILKLGLKIQLHALYIIDIIKILIKQFGNKW